MFIIIILFYLLMSLMAMGTFVDTEYGTANITSGVTNTVGFSALDQNVLMVSTLLPVLINIAALILLKRNYRYKYTSFDLEFRMI